MAITTHSVSPGDLTPPPRVATDFTADGRGITGPGNGWRDPLAHAIEAYLERTLQGPKPTPAKAAALGLGHGPLDIIKELVEQRVPARRYIDLDRVIVRALAAATELPGMAQLSSRQEGAVFLFFVVGNHVAIVRTAAL